MFRNKILFVAIVLLVVVGLALCLKGVSAGDAGGGGAHSIGVFF